MLVPVGRERRFSIASWWLRAALLSVVLVVGAAALHHIHSHERARHLSHSFDTDTLRAALTFSSNQSRVHSRLALSYLYDPLEVDAGQAVNHLQQAARLNPFDFNAWAALAGGYEETGEVEKAERSYLKALELAPAYFYPRWLYANFLLRRGQTEQAFAELLRLADINPDAVENIADLVWQSSETGADELVKLGLGIQSQRAKQSVCQLLIAREAFVPAIQVWKGLEWDQTAKPEIARELVSKLIATGEYDRAQDLWRELTKHQAGSLDETDESFWNDDFEHETVSSQSATGLDWRIASTDEVKASIVEGEKYDGQKSLLLEFLKHERVSFSGVEHSLILEPATRYQLQFWYKTKDVMSACGLSVQIEAVTVSPWRIASKEIAGGESPTEWTLASLEFETPPGVRAVAVRIVRTPSGSYYDFVKGKIWFDAFSIERIKGSDK